MLGIGVVPQLLVVPSFGRVLLGCFLIFFFVVVLLVL